MSTLVDCKQRELKVGQKVKIVKNIPSVDGMLYENTIVKISEYDGVKETIRVTDGLGKIWWIEPSAVSASFL
jgi:hypothetical protein|tara:strand:- start:677 stop:892 length:216 start_codon:yes stop_codon:yes gene_type:complete